MKLNKSKQLLILIVLAISFLIEIPLRMTIISFLSFLQPLAYIITSVIFYVALFACFLVLLKPDITSKIVIKLICVVAAFGIFDLILSVFLFSEIVVLVYEIIRPLLVFIVIFWATYWVFKSKIYVAKVFLVIMIVLFVLGALFNVLEYMRMSAMIQSIGNDFFAYLSVITPSNSIYTMLANLCTYIFTFLLFMQSKELKNNI